MRLIFSQTSIRTRRKYRFLISSHLLVLSNIVIMEKFLLPFIIMIDSCIYTAYVSNVYRCAHYMFFADCVKRNLILIRLFLAHSTIMVKTKRWIFFSHHSILAVYVCSRSICSISMLSSTIIMFEMFSTDRFD